MARSDEHDFVTRVFIESTNELSRSELYGYTEADRGLFDFACILSSNNSRQLIGQTLTHHAAGIDKDLASLLHDAKGNLPVYLYPHEARSEGRVQEFIANARGLLPERVSLLRLFRYPAFDAGNSAERKYVAKAIRDQICNDLLLNVLFGRLSAIDIELFLQGTGIHGLLLAVLHEIASNGFVNFPKLGSALNIKPSTLRSRVATLVASGMLQQAAGGSLFRATPRAQIFLRICHLLNRSSTVSSELAYILGYLDIDSSELVPAPEPLESLIGVAYDGPGKRLRLTSEVAAAVSNFGVTISNTDFDPPRGYTDGMLWIGR